MKKALIVTALAGFIKSFLINDIRILQEMGYEVICAANIHHNGADGLESFFEDNKVTFIQIDFSSNKPISKETLIAYKEIKQLSKEKYDLVHIHTPIPGVLCRMAFKKSRKKGTKIIYTTHGFYFHESSSKKNWLVYRTIENAMSRFTDAIITINKEDFSNAKKMHCKQVYYIPGVGVDISKYRNTIVNCDEYRESIGLKKSDYVVLAIGELSVRKNHEVVIRALSELKLNNIVFVICGNAMTSNNTVDKLTELSKEEGIDLRLLGLRSDIPQICKCADMGVMPSSREGLGLSGIEMIASGLPIVASNVQGIKDYLIDEVNGYLANPNDPQTFANGIKKIYEGQIKTSKEMISSSVDKFDVSKSYAEIKRIYQEVIKE